MPENFISELFFVFLEIALFSVHSCPLTRISGLLFGTRCGCSPSRGSLVAIMPEIRCCTHGTVVRRVTLADQICKCTSFLRIQGNGNESSTLNMKLEGREIGQRKKRGGCPAGCDSNLLLFMLHVINSEMSEDI